MKKILVILFLINVSINNLFAQLTQAEINKMMKEAQVEIDKMKKDPKMKEYIKDVPNLDNLKTKIPKEGIQASQQNKKTTQPANPIKKWYLSFDMTIKGTGQTKGYGEKKINASWVIDRSYVGTIELDAGIPTQVSVNNEMSPAKIQKAVESAPVMWMHTGRWLPLKVKIKDKLRKKIIDEDEGGSFENTTTLIYWDGDGTALLDNSLQVTIDKVNSSYNVTIPFSMSTTDKLMKISTHVLVERSSFGYGDAPTSESKVNYVDTSLGGLAMPVVKGLLQDGEIHHPENLPLTLVKGGYEWDSGDIEIDKPIFVDFPESKNGIMVHIYYRLKQL